MMPFLKIFLADILALLLAAKTMHLPAMNRMTVNYLISLNLCSLQMLKQCPKCVAIPEVFANICCVASVHAVEKWKRGAAVFLLIGPFFEQA